MSMDMRDMLDQISRAYNDHCSHRNWQYCPIGLFKIQYSGECAYNWASILKVHLVQFKIHCESETFQFLSRNNSWLNHIHFVKSFAPFVETFQIQWKWEGSQSESLETPIFSFQGCSTKTWNVSNRFTSKTFWFFPVSNCSKWFRPKSETFHLAKRVLNIWWCVYEMHTCMLSS
jgi:hypothetical protein